MLAAADRFHVMTARGGLLTLLLKLIGPPTPLIAMTWGFQQFFHLLAGIVMAAQHLVTLDRERHWVTSDVKLAPSAVATA